jgi:hypothetical protein
MEIITIREHNMLIGSGKLLIKCMTVHLRVLNSANCGRTNNAGLCILSRRSFAVLVMFESTFHEIVKRECVLKLWHHEIMVVSTTALSPLF